MGFCCRSYEPVKKELPKLKAGTMVFFHGRWTMGSVAIKIVTRSQITHVGLVVKYENKMCLLESGNNYHNDGLVDLLTKETRNSGVRLVDLDKRLTSAGVRIYFRHASRNDASHKLSGAECARFLKGRPYEASSLTLINSAFHFREENPNMDKVFCSELVTYYLQEYQHLLPRNGRVYSPAELSVLPIDGYEPLVDW